MATEDVPLILIFRVLEAFSLHELAVHVQNATVAMGFDMFMLHTRGARPDLMWSSHLLSEPAAKLTANEVWQAMDRLGVRHGLSLLAPAAAAGTTITLSLARAQPLDGDEQSIAKLLTSATVLASSARHALRRINEASVAPRAGARLTPREQQCLQWIAYGKTSWETAKILGVSEATAVLHLKNATKKLAAKNRVQAAAVGVALGLVMG